LRSSIGRREKSADAEVDLYDDLDALLLLRIQQWTLQDMLDNVGTHTHEDLSISQTKIVEIKQIRGNLEDWPDNNTGILSSHTAIYLMRELYKTLLVWKKLQDCPGLMQ
jgi:hypothetical protein